MSDATLSVSRRRFAAGEVAAVSAPSSLAIELATRAGVTLVAFLCGRSFNVYGCTERVVG